MKTLLRAFVALSLLVVAPSCAPIARFFEIIESTAQGEIPVGAVVIAASSFDAVKITATNYMRLRRCNGTNAPICRDPALRKRIDAAIQAGTTARDGLKAFVRAHPGKLAPKGLYDALVAATGTVKDSTAAYRAALGK